MFTQSSRLIDHMKYHTDDREFKCKICDKAFIKNDHLARHLVIHSGDRKHKCPVCDKLMTMVYNTNYAHYKTKSLLESKVAIVAMYSTHLFICAILSFKADSKSAWVIFLKSRSPSTSGDGDL